MTFPTRNGNGMEVGIGLDEFAPVASGDHFAAMDLDMAPYWIEGGLDLFTDLGGRDSGLAALMAV